jgi:uncharacterized protein involved in type VI secretion and phage assembly
MAVKSPMVLKTTLGPSLLFRSMHAEEELGRLFEFNVEALSTDGTIQGEDLLGKPASVDLDLPGGGQRHFHGLVCAMGSEGAAARMFRYRLVLRPWLWKLTRRADTRVFQKMSVEDILKKVFEPFSPDFEFQLKGAFPKYEYCVQYRETDFNFVSRLMEQEGMYYYFKHTEGKHTMVIVNAPSAHVAFRARENSASARRWVLRTIWSPSPSGVQTRKSRPGRWFCEISISRSPSSRWNQRRRLRVRVRSRCWRFTTTPGIFQTRPRAIGIRSCGSRNFKRAMHAYPVSGHCGE